MKRLCAMWSFHRSESENCLLQDILGVVPTMRCVVSTRLQLQLQCELRTLTPRRVAQSTGMATLRRQRGKLNRFLIAQLANQIALRKLGAERCIQMVAGVLSEVSTKDMLICEAA